MAPPSPSSWGCPCLGFPSGLPVPCKSTSNRTGLAEGLSRFSRSPREEPGQLSGKGHPMGWVVSNAGGAQTPQTAQSRPGSRAPLPPPPIPRHIPDGRWDKSPWITHPGAFSSSNPGAIVQGRSCPHTPVTAEPLPVPVPCGPGVSQQPERVTAGPRPRAAVTQRGRERRGALGGAGSASSQIPNPKSRIPRRG